jgi:hypothetical protein
MVSSMRLHHGHGIIFELMHVIDLDAFVLKHVIEVSDFLTGSPELLLMEKIQFQGSVRDSHKGSPLVSKKYAAFILFRFHGVLRCNVSFPSGKSQLTCQRRPADVESSKG